MVWNKKTISDQFVLVKALKAYSRDNKRYIENMIV